jgi:hypothetical protein
MPPTRFPAPLPSPKKTNAVSWSASINKALLVAEENKYFKNVLDASKVEPTTVLLLENRRAFLASREKTAARKTRIDQNLAEQINVMSIVTTQRNIASQIAWNTEAQQIRSESFKSKQRKLKKIADSQNSTALENEAMSILAVQDGVWPSTDHDLTDKLPLRVVPIRHRSGTAKKYMCVTCNEDDDAIPSPYSNAVSCMFLHMKEKSINAKAWSLDVPGLGHDVLKQICGLDPEMSIDEPPLPDLVKIGDYLTLQVQIWDSSMHLLSGHSFASYPFRCPLLYDPSNPSHPFSLIRHVVKRCDKCGQPHVPDHTCKSRDIAEWRTVGMLASLRKGGDDDPNTPLTAASTPGGAKWGHSWAEDVERSKQAEMLAERRQSLIVAPKMRVSPVKLGHHISVPQELLMTVEEENEVKREKTLREKEVKEKDFMSRLSMISPDSKRKKKSKLLKKIKKSRDDSAGESDKMVGYVSGVVGLLTLPDPGAIDYDNEMQWLLRSQTTVGQYKKNKNKEQKRELVTVEDLQRDVQEQRQVRAVNKDYDILMEESGSNLHNQVRRKKRDRKNPF